MYDERVHEVSENTSGATDTLVSQEDRHLKWRILDPVELVLLWLSGLLLAVFCSTVLLDVVTRSIGRPIGSLQEATLLAFVWGVFVGASVAMRRNQHFYLTAVAASMTGKRRLAIETFNSLVMLSISLIIAYYGYINFLRGFGNTLPVTHWPLAYYTGAIPAMGVFTALFTVERLVSGWRNGFEGFTHDVREQILREQALIRGRNELNE